MKTGRFETVELNDEQRAFVDDVRATFTQAEARLAQTVPIGRCHALMLTHLETACMWAIKGISHETPMIGMAASSIPATELGPSRPINSGMGTPMGGGMG